MNSYKKAIMAALMAFSLVTAPVVYAQDIPSIHNKILTGGLSNSQMAIPAVGGFLGGVFFNRGLKIGRNFAEKSVAVMGTRFFLKTYRPIFERSTYYSRLREVREIGIRKVPVGLDDSEPFLLDADQESWLTATKKEQQGDYKFIESCSLIAGFITSEAIGICVDYFAPRDQD